MGNELSRSEPVALREIERKRLAREYRHVKWNLLVESFNNFIDLVGRDQPMLASDDFDQVFGMLVADTEKHFEIFFQESTIASDAYQVFSAIVMLMEIDLEKQLMFLFSMYSGESDGLSPDRVDHLLRHALIGTITILGIPESQETLTFISNSLFRHDERLQGKDLVDPFDIESCINDQPIAQEYHEALRGIIQSLDSKDQAIEFFQSSALWDNGNDNFEQLSHDEFMNLHCSKTDLWIRRVGDLGGKQWLEEPLRLEHDMSCVIALKKMQTQPALVFEDSKCLGVLEYDCLLDWLLHLWPSEDEASDQLLFELKLHDVDMLFAKSTVKEAMEFQNRQLDAPMLETEFAFNAVLRFIRTGRSIIVQTKDDLILGVLTHQDLLRLILEDFALLGPEIPNRALSKMPNLFIKQVTTVNAQDTMAIEAFQLIRKKKLTGVLVLDAQQRRYAAVYPSHLALLVQNWPPTGNIPSCICPSTTVPRLESLTIRLSEFLKQDPDLPSVSMFDSVATALQVMLKSSRQRIMVLNDKKETVGVLRSSDILQCLLKEQAHYIMK